MTSSLTRSSGIGADSARAAKSVLDDDDAGVSIVVGAADMGDDGALMDIAGIVSCSADGTGTAVGPAGDPVRVSDGDGDADAATEIFRI